MNKIILIMFAITSLILAELPSYQCKEINNATFINAKGEIVPEINKASGKSKLNVSLVSNNNKNNIDIMRVNGTELEVKNVSGSYVYAIEFTYNAMHSWTLFNNKDGKPYVTMSKTYNFLGAPMTLYSLYACEKVKKIETSESKFGFYYNDAGKKIIIKSMDNIKYICGESSGGAKPAWYYVDNTGQYREVHTK